MSQEYSRPSREADPYALPDIEVYQLTAAEVAESIASEDDWMDALAEFPLANMNSRERERAVEWLIAERGITGGWFWQSCFPGCLPDGEPNGPFETYAAALADAREGMED